MEGPRIHDIATNRWRTKPTFNSPKSKHVINVYFCWNIQFHLIYCYWVSYARIWRRQQHAKCRLLQSRRHCCRIIVMKSNWRRNTSIALCWFRIIISRKYDKQVDFVPEQNNDCWPFFNKWPTNECSHSLSRSESIKNIRGLIRFVVAVLSTSASNWTTKNDAI